MYNSSNRDMRRVTDELRVKEASKSLLRMVEIQPVPNFEFIVQHPFTNSPIVQGKDNKMVNLLEPDAQKEWIQYMEEMIDSVPVKDILYHLLNTPWALTWLMMVREWLSKKDFAEFLAYSWTTQENPNMDANVDLFTIIKWFKYADKKYLMDEEDYAYWEALPEEVTLYRGVGRGRKKYGLSWTDQEETAIWFKNRWATEEEKGQLLKVVVNKKHCLAYLNTRGEKEIVLDVNAVKKDIIEI